MKYTNWAFILLAASSLIPSFAHAGGICDMLSGLDMSDPLNPRYTDGKSFVGTSYQSAPVGSKNGQLNQPIDLTDDEGKQHTIPAGQLEIGLIQTIKTRSGTFVCASIMERRSGAEYAFWVPDGSDLSKAAISAGSSGLGYGLQIMSYGGDYIDQMTPSSCDYESAPQQICETWGGRTRCYSRTVTTSGPCTQGEIQSLNLGRTVNFAITNANNEVIGTFRMAQSKY